MLISSSRGYLPNDTLAGALFAHQREVGPPRWSAADIAWMTDLSLACTPREAFALDRDVALHVDGVDPYGQDDGEISWRIPLGRVNWAFPRGVPLHHWGLSALAGHGAGDAGPMMAAEVLARGALDLARRPDVIAAAKAELARRTAVQVIGPPRCGAMRTLTQTPEAFWNATWLEG